jgi:hypothetical protein
MLTPTFNTTQKRFMIRALHDPDDCGIIKAKSVEDAINKTLRAMCQIARRENKILVPFEVIELGTD